MNAQYKLEKHLIDLEEFAYQLARCMSCPNEPEKAVQALKSVFSVIRNRFSFEQSLQFVNLLPLPLKAIYVDGWRVGENMPEQLRSMEELMDEIVASNSTEDNWYNSNRDELRNVLRSIFQIVGTHVSGSEMVASISFLPKDMQYYLRSQSFEVEDTYTDTSIWLS